MALSDPVAKPLADALLACLCEQVQLLEHPPAKCCLRTGDVVNYFISPDSDECCDGLAWVRVTGVNPGFPAQIETVSANNDIPVWSVGLEMGIARCGFGDPSYMPTCDDWTDKAHDVNDDWWAMFQAYCCFTNGKDERGLDRRGKVIPGQWTPMSLDGGCVSSILPLTVKASPCLC